MVAILQVLINLMVCRWGVSHQSLSFIMAGMLAQATVGAVILIVITGFWLNRDDIIEFKDKGSPNGAWE